jgi:hypothetical protein
MAKPQKLVAGVLAGTAASCLLSPIVTIVDVAVVKVAADSTGKTKLIQALAEGVLAWMKSPSVQLRNFAFQLVWMVYALTYATANSVKAICESTGANPVLPNLLCVTGVNMAASMYKDAALAKAQKAKESASSPSRRRTAVLPGEKPEEEKQFPMLSYLLFLVRDVLTIGSGFVLPPRVNAMLQAKGLGAAGAGVASQLLCPAGVQYVTLPFHFLALDVFNFSDSPLIERLKRLAKQYPNLTSIRVLRGIASFGLGGVGNGRFLALLDK